jgi:hypothetical protein
MSRDRVRGRDSGSLHLRIAAIVAGCGAASCSPYSAGSGPGASGELGRDVPSSSVCSLHQGFSRVAGLHLPEPVDYLSWDSGQAREEAGTSCGLAEDQEECQAAVATLRAEASTSPTAATYYLYTRGDAVGALLSEQDILEFIGPIDTLNEAAIVLSLRYRMPGCQGISEVGDGYITRSRYLARTLMPATLGNCETVEYFTVHVSRDGTTTERPSGTGLGSCPGRRPSRLLEATRSTRNVTVGAYFARLAELELAAVGAFAEIERALVAHGAPARLIERCRAAHRDEVGHTALMAELACRYGAPPEPVRFVPKASYTLLELALENAREGTSRELFGAAIAAWQARSAGEPDTRARFAEIARDEAEHAQLSLDLAAWLSERLSEEERTLVERERERAFQHLEQELEVQLEDDLRLVAGAPSAMDAKRLLRAVRAELA